MDAGAHVHARVEFTQLVHGRVDVLEVIAGRIEVRQPAGHDLGVGSCRTSGCAHHVRNVEARLLEVVQHAYSLFDRDHQLTRTDLHQPDGAATSPGADPRPELRI